MVNKIFDLILNHMITNISTDIKQTWCSPPEGYNICEGAMDHEDELSI